MSNAAKNAPADAQGATDEAEGPVSRIQGESGRAKSSRVSRAVERALERRRTRTPAGAAAAPAQAAEEDPALAYLEELSRTAIGREWLEFQPFERRPAYVQPTSGPGVIAPLPRRKLIDAPPAGDATPPMAKRVVIEAGPLRSASRFFVWMLGFTRFIFGNLFDVLAGRASIQRRAERARRILEHMGPGMVKTGQQLSIRADLLPYAYCQEFAKMLGDVKPIPSEEAIAIIERASGKKITDLFAIFDPTPFGSGSLACVYQAILHNGARVAVKVRRPGVAQDAAADLRAFGWLLSLLEQLGVLPAGNSENLMADLSQILHDELDFRKEARNTELFRRECEKLTPQYVTAPKVYPQLCNDEVIVTEFIEGVALTELLGAVDRQDHEALKALRALRIDPEGVARNMIRILNWTAMEALLFHGDPHAANMIVLPGNKIVMIDFGCCGRTSAKARRLTKQLRIYQSQGDVAGMANTAIAGMGPLPRIDVDRLAIEVEDIYWNWLYAMKSEQSEWWEKSAAHVLMNVGIVATKYGVKPELDSVRSLRVSLMYDSIAYRLWPKLDTTKEYRLYAREYAKRVKARVKKGLRSRKAGLSRGDYVLLEDIGTIFTQGLIKAQQALDVPTRHFGFLMGKASYLLSLAMRVASGVSAVAAIFVVANDVCQRLTGTTVALSERLAPLFGTPTVVVLLATLSIGLGRVRRRLTLSGG